MSDGPSEGMLTTREAARLLGCCPGTVITRARRAGVLIDDPTLARPQAPNQHYAVPESWVRAVVRVSAREKEDALLAAIARYWGEHGIPPTIRELQRALNISSTSLVAHRLKRLERRGLVQRDPKITRSIRIVKTIEV